MNLNPTYTNKHTEMTGNPLKITKIEPGAQIEETVYDQWITIKHGDKQLSLFDQDMITPQSALGTLQIIRIGIMATNIKKTQGQTEFTSNIQFTGKVVSRKKDQEYWSYVVEVGGLNLELIDSSEWDVDTVLSIRGRLDMIEILGLNDSGWSS